jgi:N-methylhydantoinase A
VARFHEHHRHTYGVELDAPVELVNFRVRLVRVAEKPPPADAADTGPLGVDPSDPSAALVATRPVHFFESGGYVPTPVHDWGRLPVGAELAGPAIVDGTDTTVVIPPTHTALVDARRTLVLKALR